MIVSGLLDVSLRLHLHFWFVDIFDSIIMFHKIINNLNNFILIKNGLVNGLVVTYYDRPRCNTPFKVNVMILFHILFKISGPKLFRLNLSVKFLVFFTYGMLPSIRWESAWSYRDKNDDGEKKSCLRRKSLRTKFLSFFGNTAVKSHWSLPLIIRIQIIHPH